MGKTDPHQGKQGWWCLGDGSEDVLLYMCIISDTVYDVCFGDFNDYIV